MVAVAVSACLHSAPGPQTPVRTGYLNGADSVRLFFRAVGQNPDTVVVVHGFQGNNMEYLYSDLLPLAAEHTLIFYDQRGSGRSDPVTDATKLGIENHVKDLEAVRRDLGADRMTVLAHSGGAGIAALYALRHPGRVKRMVLVSPIPPARDPYSSESQQRFLARLDTATFARANALQRSITTAPDPRAICMQVTRLMLPRAFFRDSASFARMKGDFCSAPPEVLRTQPARLAAFQRSLGAWDWRRQLAGVEVPVLVVHGAHDAIPLDASRAWIEALPNSRLLVLARSDHLPFVEEPARFFAAVNAFLAGRWPSDAHAATR